jgi:hypothetical protein
MRVVMPTDQERAACPVHNDVCNAH